ncbi:MAG: DUF2845 domain-containing protein [Gammaproteobacteria bacterium]
MICRNRRRLPGICGAVVAAGVVLGLGLATGAHADSTLRCDGGVVVTGDHLSDVLRKCGEPVFAMSSSKIVGGGYDYYGNRLPGREVVVEQLTFDFGYGRFRQTMRFEDGRLTGMTRGERND